jgi:hypothetical protein
MFMNFLAPETSHIMALKIKDYIIYSLLLTHHYLRLILMIIVTVGLTCQVELPVARAAEGIRLSRRLDILWLIVANHDCIYWLYLYGPDPLYPYLLLYYTLHPPGKLPFPGQCERLSRRLV